MGNCKGTICLLISLYCLFVCTQYGASFCHHHHSWNVEFHAAQLHQRIHFFKNSKKKCNNLCLVKERIHCGVTFTKLCTNQKVQTLGRCKKRCSFSFMCSMAIEGLQLIRTQVSSYIQCRWNDFSESTMLFLRRRCFALLTVEYVVLMHLLLLSGDIEENPGPTSQQAAGMNPLHLKKL